MFWLIAQILFCLLIAGLLGLFLGWLIWGRRPDPEPVVRTDTEALDAAKARIQELEAELADCRAKVIDTSVASASGVDAAPAGAETSYGLFGPVADRPIDDLKAISGIGQIIEKQLAGIGVVTYRQIAAFDEVDIERVQEAIDFFPGRIVREGWIEQAESLHREKYGDTA
ncbi:MAG: hypothetical protein AAF170_05710 [Bacteroidota bacterium]